jgi:uncharacterized protein YndB with AHSA1/START domain
MTRWQESVMVDRPVEDVWKFVTDMSELPKWNPQVLEPRQTSSGPLGVGATVEFGARMRSSTMTISMRVTEYESNRRFSFEHTSGPLVGTTESDSFESIEGKTKLTRMGDVKFRGFYKLVGPFVTPRWRKDVVSSLDNVKRILETQAGA